jgi:hypothetical protein
MAVATIIDIFRAIAGTLGTIQFVDGSTRALPAVNTSFVRGAVGLDGSLSLNTLNGGLSNTEYDPPLVYRWPVNHENVGQDDHETIMGSIGYGNSFVLPIGPDGNVLQAPPILIAAGDSGIRISHLGIRWPDDNRSA